MDANNNGADRKRRRNDEEFLALKLACFNQHAAPDLAPPPPMNFPSVDPTADAPAASPAAAAAAAVNVLHRRTRRNPSKTPPRGKSAVIPPPYPWADCFRATVRSLAYLRANGITAIGGDVQCKKCEQKFMIEFDLEQKFEEVARLIVENKASMAHRAPKFWLSPALPNCGLCKQEGCVKPVISEKKKSINWLFLLLGQMLGLCTLDQLKYFCKHTENHRTGAKDRVLFLTYLKLCKQLDPNGPFDI